MVRQARHAYSADGILMAAMDHDDAACAAKLLGDPEILSVSSGHLVHFERPEDYLRAIRRLDAAVT